MTDGNGLSALDRAGGHAAVHFLLEEKEEDKDGDDGDDDAGTDEGEANIGVGDDGWKRALSP